MVSASQIAWYRPLPERHRVDVLSRKGQARLPLSGDERVQVGDYAQVRMRTIVFALRSLDSRRPLLLDGIVAAWFVFLGLVLAATLAEGGGEFRTIDAGGVALTVAQTAPLLFRRRWPLATLAVILMAVVTLSAAGYEANNAGLMAAVVGFYTVVERETVVRVATAALLCAATISLFYLTTREEVESFATEALDAGAAFGGALLLGIFVRTRRAQTVTAVRRAAQLEEEQEMATEAAIADERKRISRELHDAVGHALNLVVIQAGAAERVISVHPERAHQALDAIQSAGRQALTDLDRMLGILDAPATTSGGGATPGMARLEALVAQTREAGLPVGLTVDGSPRPLSRSTDQSAYRIVQEALTNALKHRGLAPTEVRVHYGRAALEIEVVDEGPGGQVSVNGSGRGLAGMRERARLFGGELEAGPGPDGGYRIRALLPIERDAQ